MFLNRAITDDAVARVADALVLTEWKKVGSRQGAGAKADEARKQAGMYNRGVLGGIELANYCYVVLVSQDWLSDIADVVDNGLTYRILTLQ